jgi:tRNA uracil 4-sulfurtransferase
MPVTPLAAARLTSDAVPLHEPCVLLKLGEVVLKGKNRQRFERMLHGNIRRAVRDLGVEIRIWQREGVIVLRLVPPIVTALDSTVLDSTVLDSTVLDSTVLDSTSPGWPDAGAADRAADLVAERMGMVMGLARVCRAVRVAKDPDAAIAAAVELSAGRSGSFAVRARRRDKRFPITSAQLAIQIGTRIQQQHGYSVNLRTPDFTVFVEVDQREVFVYTDGRPGQGGLPIGMSGRALVLMSGGIDSPVAAYRMMRRGLRCGFLHFSGMPLTGPESVYKAYGLVRQLDRYQGGARLFVVAFGNTQRKLASCGAGRLQIMAQRRLMLKTGEALARRLHAGALVTGDSLGQVSSQTLTNITALDDAVSLPILRPLIGLDKSEIITEARRISTLDISELPDEDCCSLLTPRQAETRARIADLRRIEARLDADDLAEELAAAAQEHTPGRAGG